MFSTLDFAYPKLKARCLPFNQKEEMQCFKKKMKASCSLFSAVKIRV